MIKFIACLFISCPVLGYAQVFTIGEELINSRQDLTDEYIIVFEDTSSVGASDNLTSESFQAKFLPRSLIKTYGKKSTIWIKASLANTSSQPRDLVVSFNDWDVTVMSLSGDVVSYSGRHGILSPSSGSKFYLGENIGTRLVTHLLPGDTITYYVKSPGFLDESAFFIAIQDLKSMDKQIQRDLWAIGIFTGCFFFICLATFFLFIKSLRWRSIFYAIYAIGGYLFFSGYYGVDFFIPTQLPISYTIFLPLSSLFYLLFVYHFLELNKVRFQGKIFLIYIVLLAIAILVLIYAFVANHEIYYHFLRKVNRINIWFTVFSLLVIMRVPGKQKYFVFGGVFFLFLGGTIYVYMKEIRTEYYSFIYPMMGFMLEMMTFLIGNFYVLSMEHRRSIRKLHEKEKELIEKKAELMRFTSMIKEKNRLIDGFKSQLEKREGEEEIFGSDLSFNGTIDHLMQSTILTSDEWTEFKKLFNQVYTGFLSNVRIKYPDLTETEERLMALTKLNLNNKEIASMLGISLESVIKSRYRLRKKLNVESGEIETIVAGL